METKEFKVIVPEGMEIDKENSTFECIKFKPITKGWRDNKLNQLQGYYITIASDIVYTAGVNYSGNYNVFATQEQAKSALAMAQISQIMANDKRFGGVVTDEEWNNSNINKYCITRNGFDIDKPTRYTVYGILAFHTPAQRDLFLEENEDLVKDYFCLD